MNIYIKIIFLSSSVVLAACEKETPFRNNYESETNKPFTVDDKGNAIFYDLKKIEKPSKNDSPSYELYDGLETSVLNKFSTLYPFFFSVNIRENVKTGLSEGVRIDVTLKEMENVPLTAADIKKLIITLLGYLNKNIKNKIIELDVSVETLDGGSLKLKLHPDKYRKNVDNLPLIWGEILVEKPSAVDLLSNICKFSVNTNECIQVNKADKNIALKKSGDAVVKEKLEKSSEQPETKKPTSKDENLISEEQRSVLKEAGFDVDLTVAN